MGGLALLAEAEATGLSVGAEGDRLVVRGPASAEGLARRLIAEKGAVLAALAGRRNGAEGFAPLDRAIAAGEAARHSHGAIAGRLARLEEQASRPGATGMDRQLAADWRAILAAKDAAAGPAAARGNLPHEAGGRRSRGVAGGNRQGNQ